jgi:hypothetical protein
LSFSFVICILTELYGNLEIERLSYDFLIFVKVSFLKYKLYIA